MESETITIAFLTELVGAQPCEGMRNEPELRFAYLRCGNPAIAVIKGDDPRAYFMCGPCAIYSVKHRGGILWFTVDKYLQEILRKDHNAA